MNRLITTRIKKFLFIQEITRIINDPQILIHNENDILQRLVYLWGNEGWSGLSSYLSACLNHTEKADGYILECGSGLSTILMGIIAKSKQIKIISLENSKKWKDRTSWYLKRFNLNNVTILYTPIIDRGTYQWYDLEKSTIPEKVSLVVLDGPPGDIKGGRTGFFPECKELITTGTVILVDDVIRKDEMQMVIEYSASMDFRYDITTVEKPYATMIKN